jgi:Flp pilus assembly protein TadD
MKVENKDDTLKNGGIILGKASRKLVKQQQKNKTEGQQNQVAGLKEKIAEYKEAGKYEEALEVVIELLQMKCYDIEVLFDAAELYFMAGDYERTTVWINKTLEFSPEHIEARILLTRICMLTDRSKDGLNIMEFVLRKKGQQLTEEQKVEIEEILEYFRYTSDADELTNGYPYVAKFLGLITEPATESLVKDIVYEGKDNIMNTSFADKKTVEDEPKEQNIAETDKTLLQSVEMIKASIMDKNVSLQEKISLCNSFAGAYYYEDKLADAETLLLSAFSLDEYNSETLRNLAVLALANDDKKTALQYAAKLSQTDFALIKLIKEA